MCRLTHHPKKVVGNYKAALDANSDVLKVQIMKKRYELGLGKPLKVSIHEQPVVDPGGLFILFIDNELYARTENTSNDPYQLFEVNHYSSNSKENIK
jgi:hypothetical protein